MFYFDTVYLGAVPDEQMQLDFITGPDRTYYGYLSHMYRSWSADAHHYLNPLYRRLYVISRPAVGSIGSD